MAGSDTMRQRFPLQQLQEAASARINDHHSEEEAANSPGECAALDLGVSSPESPHIAHLTRARPCQHAT
eukprot:1711978-Rhodomonas_salina.1